MTAAIDLADLAAEQWGLVTTAQARTVGVSAQSVARLANQGALERVTHGVYRVAGTPAEPLDSLRAAWLTLDPKRRASERLRDRAPSVVSHRSAASIHHLGNLDADEFEFTTSERKQTRRPDIRIHRGSVKPEEWSVVDGLPVTTPIRTIDDLAADRIDGGHLAGIVRDALIRQQVDGRELVAVLRRHAHRYGAPMGDGEALLHRLLQESGVSEPIATAVKFAAPAQISTQQLAEQLVTLQRMLESSARLPQQMASSSAAMRALAELARSPAVKRLAKEYAEVAEISRLARDITEGIDPATTAVPELVGGKIEKG